MAFSQATLVSRIRRILGDNPYSVPCTDNVAAGDTTVDVPDGTEFEEGNVIEWQDNGDQAFVRSVATNTLTVIRSWNGTTATAHDGSGTAIVVVKDPLIQYVQITQAITRVILTLYPYVYKKLQFTITPVAGTVWYDVGVNYITLVDLSSVTQVLDSTRLFFYGTRGDTYPINFSTNVPTTLCTNGVGIYVPFLRSTATNININGIAKITDTVATNSYSDLTEGVQVDAVTYMTVADLILATDIPRTTQEDVSMGDATVKPLTRTQLGDFWYRKGLAARRQWELELIESYPRMSRNKSARPSSRW